MNADDDLAADFQRRRQQQIHGPADGSFGRILDRDHGVVGVSGLDLAENIVNRNLRQQMRRMAEMFGCGRFGKGAQGAEESNAERLFERQAGRHHFTEKEGDVFVGQGAWIRVLQAAQDLCFALRAVDMPGFAMLGLDLANLLGTLGALVEQAQQFAVDAVDFSTYAGQGFLQVGLLRVAHKLNRYVWRNRS